MWAKRWSGLNRKNRLTLLLEAKRRRDEPVLDLTGSNPTRAGFDYPEEAILRAMRDRRALDYDPSPLGLLGAREAVARYCAERGAEVSPEDVVLTSGTSESYGYLLQILTEPGDWVSTPVPSYPLFDFLARAASVRRRSYPLHYTGRWEPDLAVIRRQVRRKSRAVLLVQPNNPTGSFVTPAEMETLSNICAEGDAALICDEVFYDYRWSEREFADPLAEYESLSFALNGLSKISGLPQMKLGWIILRGPARRKLQARRRLELAADTFLTVGAPVQAAAVALLEARRVIQPQIAARAAANLAFLSKALKGSAAEVPSVEGGWTSLVRLPRVCGEEEWALGLLERQNTLVHPGYFYDFPQEAFVALSLLTSETDFQAGVKRLLAELKRRTTTLT